MNSYAEYQIILGQCIIPILAARNWKIFRWISRMHFSMGTYTMQLLVIIIQLVLSSGRVLYWHKQALWVHTFSFPNHAHSKDFKNIHLTTFYISDNITMGDYLQGTIILIKGAPWHMPQPLYHKWCMCHGFSIYLFCKKKTYIIFLVLNMFYDLNS